MHLLIAMSIVFASLHSWSAEHGEVQQTENGVKSWHEGQQQWLSIEAFWQDYANNKTSKSWPTAAEYPDYDSVNEGDTFLVQLKGSACLMEFFHSRWRRANDVRRWDDGFNAYGACPIVFD